MLGFSTKVHQLGEKSPNVHILEKRQMCYSWSISPRMGGHIKKWEEVPHSDDIDSNCLLLTPHPRD